MKNLQSVSLNEIEKICSLINEQYKEHNLIAGDGVPALCVQLKHVEKGSFKYLQVYQNGMIELFTLHPISVVRIRQLKVHALLITDYLRQKGYEFTL